MYKTMTNDEFYQKTKRASLAILDVRESDEFAAGHIPEAKNLPLSELAEGYQELGKSTAYYVICHSGGRSARACEFLSAQGFDVTNILGGMMAWKGALS